MKKHKKLIVTSALVGMFCTTVHAKSDTLDLEISLPLLNVAEYHKPYIAFGLEDDKTNASATRRAVR